MQNIRMFAAFSMLAMSGLVLAPSLCAQQAGLSFSLAPRASIPLGLNSTLFKTAYGGELGLRYALPEGGLAFSLALGYDYAPLVIPGSISMVSPWLGAEYRFPLGPAFSIGPRLGGGITWAAIEGDATNGSVSALVEGGISAGLALGPSFSLDASLSYRLIAGLRGEAAATLAARFAPRFAAGPVVPSLEFGPAQFDQVFPVFHAYYDDHAIGKVTIHNASKKPVENVRLSLFIRQYMDAPKECGSVAAIEAGKSVDLPLYALFRNTILDVTEATKVQAELGLSWKQDGEEVTRSQAATLALENRNGMTWVDDDRAAAFVTAKDPVILEYAKNVASAGKGLGSDAIDAPFKLGMAMFDSLLERGIAYTVDPTSPYAASTRKSETVDFLQFPRQTLSYKAGDCDDLSIMYCALLESLGLETAFITIPGHIYAAFALKMAPDEVLKTFAKPESLILLGGKAWVPVETTALSGTFLQAWELGAQEWQKNLQSKEGALHPLATAWAKYPPAALVGSGVVVAVPDFSKRYASELSRFTDVQMAPRLAALTAEATKTGATSAAINSLGVFYARWGRLAEARKQFELSTAKGSYLPAYVNLGTIFYVLKDWQSAIASYGKALAMDAKNAKVLLGLSRSYAEIGDQAFAAAYHQKLAAVNPEIAAQYAWLGSSTGTTRAADAASGTSLLAWED